MKKKITAILLILSILLTLLTSLTSCSTYDDSDETTEETEEEINDGSIKASKEFREVLPKAKRVIDIKPLLLGLSDLVLEAYEETSGKGYIFRITSEGYKPGMEVLIGIDANGKITGSKCIATNDTFGKEKELDNAYNGQTASDFDSVMITGATFTSRGYADAITVALQSYVLASGGKLDPAVLLEALVPELAPGFANPTQIDAPAKVQKALKASNNAGFAYIFSNGTVGFLAIVNAAGNCAVYDVNGNEVSSEYPGIKNDAIEFASSNQESYFKQLEKKIKKFYSNASEIKEVSFNTFNTVVAAAEFTSDGNKYYAYYSRSVGFNQMDVYVILDAKGSIAKLDAEKFIFDEEYFSSFKGLNYSEYTSGFNGLTEDSFASDTCIISGATMTSRAVEQSVRDAFETAKNLIN